MTVFEKKLLHWYKKHGRHTLPWRKQNITPYEVWVSEIMLQQTQVGRVIEYYTRFLKRFPTIQSLAKATWEEFYPYYAGLGYYNRGRNMLKCAQILVEQYKGIFPNNKKDLVALPGIGEYTASAILSFGYNQDELAIDTNVQKVLGRVFYGSRKIQIKNKIEEFKDKLQANKRELNAAIMDFSNVVCTRTPRCEICPLQKICVYYETNGEQEKLLTQKKTETKEFPFAEASVYLTLHKDHKEYYSTSKKNYQPFLLSAKYNTREKIKEYFREKYNLELSVRPPHKKIFIDGQPVLFVNAQILTGKHNFFAFSKKDLLS